MIYDQCLVDLVLRQGERTEIQARICATTTAVLEQQRGKDKSYVSETTGSRQMPDRLPQ
jgi:hypothetical protein